MTMWSWFFRKYVPVAPFSQNSLRPPENRPEGVKLIQDGTKARKKTRLTRPGFGLDVAVKPLMHGFRSNDR
ncbi:hypothetical protein, partial [Pseudomonas agarici]